MGRRPSWTSGRSQSDTLCCLIAEGFVVKSTESKLWSRILFNVQAYKPVEILEICVVDYRVLYTQSHMKAFDINPNEEWISMAMIGVSPQILMKSAHKSVMFYVGQSELEKQYKMNRIQAQYRQKFEAMQIYNQLRSEYESVKRSTIQPSTNFFSRNEPDIFSNQANIMMDNREAVRKDWLVLTPETPGPKEDIWPARQNSSNSGGPFDITLESPAKQAAIPVDAGNRRAGGHPMFGNGARTPQQKNASIVTSFTVNIFVFG